jgi:hypothetical protein
MEAALVGQVVLNRRRRPAANEFSNHPDTGTMKFDWQREQERHYSWEAVERCPEQPIIGKHARRFPWN